MEEYNQVPVTHSVAVGLSALQSIIRSTRTVSPVSIAHQAKSMGYIDTANWISRNPDQFTQGLRTGFILQDQE